MARPPRVVLLCLLILLTLTSAGSRYKGKKCTKTSQCAKGCECDKVTRECHDVIDPKTAKRISECPATAFRARKIIEEKAKKAKDTQTRVLGKIGKTKPKMLLKDLKAGKGGLKTPVVLSQGEKCTKTSQCAKGCECDKVAHECHDVIDLTTARRISECPATAKKATDLKAAIKPKKPTADKKAATQTRVLKKTKPKISATDLKAAIKTKKTKKTTDKKAATQARVLGKIGKTKPKMLLKDLKAAKGLTPDKKKKAATQARVLKKIDKTKPKMLLKDLKAGKKGLKTPVLSQGEKCTDTSQCAKGCVCDKVARECHDVFDSKAKRISTCPTADKKVKTGTVHGKTFMKGATTLGKKMANSETGKAILTDLTAQALTKGTAHVLGKAKSLTSVVTEKAKKKAVPVITKAKSTTDVTAKKKGKKKGKKGRFGKFGRGLSKLAGKFSGKSTNANEEMFGDVYSGYDGYYEGADGGYEEYEYGYENEGVYGYDNSNEDTGFVAQFVLMFGGIMVFAMCCVVCVGLNILMGYGGWVFGKKMWQSKNGKYKLVDRAGTDVEQNQDELVV